MDRQRAARLRHRAAFAAAHDPAIPALDDAALLERLDEWLPPLLAGKRRLDAIDPARFATRSTACSAMRRRARIDRLAPTHFTSPAGVGHPIDYAAPGGPTVEVRAQALYGLKEHPTVAGGRVPLTLAITSPAHRPIQTTRDLPAFWAGAGARSPRKCAAATRATRGPTIPPPPRRRCAPSGQALDSRRAACAIARP